MTDTHQNLMRKGSELPNYYTMAEEAFKANNVNQALEISNNGLEQAKLEENGEWVDKFSLLQDKLENKHLSPSIIKEDITIIKGIGTTASIHLNEAGITSIEQLAKMTVDQLVKVRGIGPASAEKIIQGAKSHYSTRSLDTFSQSTVEVEYQEEDSGDAIEDFQDNEEDEVIEEMSHVNSELKQKPWFDPKYKRGPTEEWHEPPGIMKVQTITEDLKDIIEEEVGDFEFEKPEGLDDIKIQKVDLENDVIFEGNSVEENQFDTSTSIVPEIMEPVVMDPPIKFVNKQVLSHPEIQELSRKISKRLKEGEFFLIDKSPQLREIYQGIDILAVKLVDIKNTLQIISIIPIKINVIDGSFLVSSNKIRLKANNNDIGPAIERKLEAYTITLANAYKTVFDSMVNHGVLYHYLNKYLGLGLTEEKSKIQKNPYFRSGPLQYKAVISPMLVSQNDVNFTEKILPFAYQKESNLYIVSIKNFSNLLQYLDQKYYCIESHNKDQTSVSSNNKIISTTMRRVRLSSIPPLLAGVFFFVFSIMQGFSKMTNFTNLGYGIFALYVIVLVYFYIFNNRRKTSLRQKFSTPYHKREIEIDEPSLILIREELDPKLMEQFAYECLSSNNGSKIIANVERNNAQEFLAQKTIQKKVSKANLFESKRKDFGDDITKKYSSFLED